MVWLPEHHPGLELWIVEDDEDSLLAIPSDDVIDEGIIGEWFDRADGRPFVYVVAADWERAIEGAMAAQWK